MEQGKFGPVQLAAYLELYVLLLLPNMVIVGACTVVVPRRPTHAGIDPRDTFIEGERGDNVIAVAADGRRSGDRP